MSTFAWTAPLAALALAAAPAGLDGGPAPAPDGGAAAPAAACGLPPLRPGARPFRTGEVLGFDLDVMGVVKAGTLTLAVEAPISRGELLPLRARLRNTSVFAKARRVKGYALSWVHAGTLRPQRYRDDVDEDGVRKATDTVLDQPGPVVMSWSFGEQRGTTELERERDVLDLLSFVYYLRAAALAPGTPICTDLVANRRFWRFRGEVAASPEKVETAAGTFDTVRVDGVLKRADGKGPDRPVHFWYSKDARRLPVAAVSEVDMGPVRVMLGRTSGSPQPGE
jgi:hypothetical protein